MRIVATATLLLPASLLTASCSSPDNGLAPSTDSAVGVAVGAEGTDVHINAVTEAPTGFDNLSNGSCTQADMDAAKVAFSKVLGFADGVGPCFNNTSCISCHEAPLRAAGTASQVNERRAGHFNGTSFVDHPGGSLINDRATDVSIQEQVLPGNEVLAFRISLSIMGDGFVESVDSDTLAAIAANQPAGQRGTVIQVPVVEAGGTTRVGRFGWKDQNASLLTFAGDAYLNEIGITNRLFPTENTCNGTVVQGGPVDGKPEVEDDANGIDELALFMRCLKAPPRGLVTSEVSNGQLAFVTIGCAVCHVQTITTAPAGTVVNGGAFTVPAALGDKNIHPFSDFLLHDLGTGDGIVQNGGQGTRNMIRTAPLWGIRARTRFMHDGASATITDAIQRHGNQAATMRNNFNNLGATARQSILAFISSL